ncbi:MAG TPA: outer membrane protein assembly factor BamA [Vicinamibacterales bacterium]
MSRLHLALILAAGVGAFSSAPARAQQPPATEPPPAGSPAPSAPAPSPDSQTQPAPSTPAPGRTGQAPQGTRLPPEGSPPLVRFIQLSFPTQGEQPVIDPRTYLYYIQTQVSRPADGVWVPYTEETEESIREDFKRLWATNFLDDLSIEVLDDPYPNGVMGKRIVYKMEERQRVKIVDYEAGKEFDQSKLEEVLKDQNLMIRIDSFIDPSIIRRVEGIIREMMSAKGFQYAEVSHEIKPMSGGPKLVHLTFKVENGPKVKMREIEFEGNTAMSDGELRGRLKNNKPMWWLSWITGRGTWQEAMFEEDADRIIEHYRNHGYIAARVGQPEITVLNDSKDGKERFIKVTVPVTEGQRYRVGSFDFDGNTVVKAEALRPLFRLKEGDYYSEEKIRKGLEIARELYGTGGYWEFTGYPDLKPRNLPDPSKMNDPEAIAEAEKQPPIVDVTMRLQEGEQYFVNRITFVGNTTTRDNVIRREIRLLENGVFNTEALKYSVRRINQLGYFKPIEEGKDTVKVEKTPGQKNKVDITLTFEEQNRNQLTFGAGVSQFEGFFGQLAFQTSNFMGRGESLTFSVLAGRRVQNYQLAFQEPFLFDRPITAGFDLYKREIQYYFSYTQEALGGNVVTGFPVGDFSRMYLMYSLEQARVKDIDPLLNNNEIISRNPFLADALLINEGGRRTISQITPSWVLNTIDNPIFPNSGKRYSLSLDVAGIGGNVNFLKPRGEVVFWIPTGSRMTLGMRAAYEYIRPYGSTEQLPIFERLFLGGEYSVRGYDIRSIGPRDIGTPQQPGTFIVLGGNKSALFNAEYHFAIAPQVRLLGFFDAGQVRDVGEHMRLDEFVMSTGAEVRFFMPVLNVPFRLIYAHNINREGIFDNNLLQTKANVFRFAVGATF